MSDVSFDLYPLMCDYPNRCVLVAVERAFHIYTGSGSSFTESAMLHCHVSTVAQNRQKKLALSRELLVFVG